MSERSDGLGPDILSSCSFVVFGEYVGTVLSILIDELSVLIVSMQRPKTWFANV